MLLLSCSCLIWLLKWRDKLFIKKNVFFFQISFLFIFRLESIHFEWKCLYFFKFWNRSYMYENGRYKLKQHFLQAFPTKLSNNHVDKYLTCCQRNDIHILHIHLFTCLTTDRLQMTDDIFYLSLIRHICAH